MNSDTAIILDNHKIFGDSFAILLEKYYVFETVHSFQDPTELLQFLVQNNPKKVHIFLDYYLKDTNGLSVLGDIRRISKQHKIIFLTSTNSWPVVHHIETKEPDAILSKLIGLDILLECLREVALDNFYMCSNFKELKANSQSVKPVIFTPRELEILHFFASGHTIAQTAEKAFLSTHTIVAHRRNMMSKAKCNSISQLISYAQQWQLI